MSEPVHENLPADVRELLDLERRAAGAPREARVRVAERLGLGSVPAVPFMPARLAGWSTRARSLAALVLVVVAGSAFWLAARTREPLALPSATPGAPATATARATTTTPPIEPEPPTAPPAGPAARETEITLLTGARRALRAHDPARAMALLRRHERRWPRGELIQEREVLAVQALAAIGASEQARLRADRFLTRFPESTLAGTVRELRRQVETDGAR